MTEGNKREDLDLEEQELFYEEPPRSTLRENIGILFALLSLFIIGFAGYIWLTPGLEFSDYLKRSGEQEMAATSDSGTTQSQDSGHDMAAMANDVRCPVCNMFALRSKSAIMASWSDGSETHHDSWDCVANWARDNDLQLRDAQVVAFTEADGESVWLNAGTAWYRYDTEAGVFGSMPPNVAAFADQATVKAAADMGGEAVDFSGLLAKAGIEPAAMNAEKPSMEDSATNTMEGMEGMDHSQPAGNEETSSAGQMAEDTPAQDSQTSLFMQAGFTDNACPVCGMFADRSMTHVVVKWKDGSFTQHDSFDCAIGQLANGSGQIDKIEVSLYDVDNPGSHWMDARSASFLYDTSRIKGSMPPFVAAFGSPEEASAAQSELGGEQLSFTELAARWQQ